VNARGGIDLGGTKVQAVVVNAAGRPLGSARAPTPLSGGPPDVAQAMVAALREAAAAAEVDVRELAGIGVGSPGEVDVDAGLVSNVVNLPGWGGGFALGETLTSVLGVPVTIGNDVQVATNAEARLGAGRPYSSLLGVFWGTGVGGGIVLNGRPWVGRGAAAEIGHMVVRRGGARCPCGRRGCLEAYAGRAAMEARARRLGAQGERTALFRIMEERGRDRLTSGVWARALAQGDPLAERLLARAVRALGAGIASAVNLLDVEAVVVGGGLGLRLGEPFVHRIRAAMMPHLFADDRPPVVEPAALGDLGGAIGAALLVPAPRGRRQSAQRAGK
jgi:glucokinase